VREEERLLQEVRGRHLCKACFLHSIEKEGLEDHQGEQNDSTATGLPWAVSGGKDSTTLLHILHGLAGHRKDVEIFAISADEGIRDTAQRTSRGLPGLQAVGCRASRLLFQQGARKGPGQEGQGDPPDDQIREPARIAESGGAGS